MVPGGKGLTGDFTRNVYLAGVTQGRFDSTPWLSNDNTLTQAERTSYFSVSLYSEIISCWVSKLRRDASRSSK